MNPHLKASRGKVFTHLQNTILYIFAVFGIKDILFKLVTIYFFCFCFISQHQQCLIMASKYFIDIDADKDLYLFYVSKLFSQFKITGGTKKTDNGKESVEIGHPLCNAF